MIEVDPSLPECPDVLKNESGALTSIAGWTKSLLGAPTFDASKIKDYYQLINDKLTKKSTLVKKNFERGSQLLEESFISVDSVYVKEVDSLYCIKGVCAASLKKKDRWVTIALSKDTADIKFAFCQCTAGRTGTCSHTFALMKLLAKWVLDNLTEIPKEVACTSKLCYWSVPQGRDRTTKALISEINFVSPESHRKRKLTNDVNSDEDNEDIEPRPKKKNRANKGIVSTLYDPRSLDTRHVDQDKLSTLFSHLQNDNVMAANVINENLSKTSVVSTTQFGKVPVGSVLSNQCPSIPSDFKVYCNIDTSRETELTMHIYPTFPFVLEEDDISEYLRTLSSQTKIDFIEKLKISKHDVNVIERDTIEQANNPDWFMYRAGRFTASRNNQLSSRNPKTDRGFISLAKSFVSPPVNINPVVQYKMGFGRFYEPIAITRYEQYMKFCNYNVQVEKCGLVLDSVNFVLGASPYGKVIDSAETMKFGIMEVKCSEEYKDFDPKSISFISKTSCIELVGNDLKLKKSHSYYDQVQLQLALTTHSWCDFVLFTLKGMVIDRVQFDPEHWKALKDKLLRFYFKYLLDAFIEKE